MIRSLPYLGDSRLASVLARFATFTSLPDAIEWLTCDGLCEAHVEHDAIVIATDPVSGWSYPTDESVHALISLGLYSLAIRN